MNSDCSTDAGASFELNSIIAQLKHESGTLPERAIHGARQNAEQITPALIELIDHATREHRQGRTPQDNGHLLSLYLLAEFRATEAWPSLLEAISLPDEGPFDLFGDAITEDFAYIIATLAGDRHQDVAALLSDRSIDVFVRWQAAEAMMHFVRDGIVTRESAIGQMEAHLHQAIEDGDGELAECFVFRLEDLAAESAVPLIEDVFRRGLIDQNLVTLEPILADIARGEQQFQDSMSRLKVVEDLVEHLKDWAEFSSYDDDVSDDLLFEQLFDAEDPATPGTGSLNAERDPSRIGRNEPCTCGSGKKYKKCCGRR